MPTDIGEMQVGLSLDESSFNQSMNDVGQKMDELSGKFDSVHGDTKRAEVSLGGLGKSFALMGLAGVTGLTAIAKGTPAVAGSMASIGISVMRVKHQIGEELAPAFEKFATGLEQFADDVESKGTLIAILDKLAETTDKLIVDPITAKIEERAETFADPTALFSLDRLGVIGKIIQLFKLRNQKENDEFLIMNSPNTIIE